MPPIRRPFRVQATKRFQEPVTITASIEAPEKSADTFSQRSEGWQVTVFNNEENTYEQVIAVLQAATGCDYEEAYIETWEIDHFGLCIVHRADEDECHSAAQIISTIGIRVVVGPSS